MDTLTAWSSLATAVGTVALAVLALCAWRVAAGTLEASRRASAAAEAANEQARRDSIEQTRPYVLAEVIPGLAGAGSYDVRLSNTGRSSARQLTLVFDQWPAELDDVADTVQTLFETPRTLPPGSSLRAMWRLEGNFGDGTSEAGMGKVGTMGVRYTSTDPSSPQYFDDFDVQIETSGLWPMPEEGPKPNGLDDQMKQFYKLGQVMVRRVGELSR